MSDVPYEKIVDAETLKTLTSAQLVDLKRDGITVTPTGRIFRTASYRPEDLKEIEEELNNRFKR